MTAMLVFGFCVSRFLIFIRRPPLCMLEFERLLPKGLCRLRDRHSLPWIRSRLTGLRIVVTCQPSGKGLGCGWRDSDRSCRDAANFSALTQFDETGEVFIVEDSDGIRPRPNRHRTLNPQGLRESCGLPLHRPCRQEERLGNLLVAESLCHLKQDRLLARRKLESCGVKRGSVRHMQWFLYRAGLEPPGIVDGAVVHRRPDQLACRRRDLQGGVPAE